MRDLSSGTEDGTSRLADQIRRACLVEATARKPGNVHPEAPFADLCYNDFVQSADAASEWLARAGELGVGPAVLQAVEATRQRVQTNTNLGIALLIAPLAAVPFERSLFEGIGDVLNSLTLADSLAVFEAIRRVSPGGLGEAPEQDVHHPPTLPLREVMQLAADRDRIARQYTRNFEDVLNFALPTLAAWRERVGPEGDTAVIGLHLSLLAEFPDSLIARKCGLPVAQEAQRRAAAVLSADWPNSSASRTDLISFDTWLREDGHRRNPGTTADLVAATLFADLRESSREIG